MKYLLALLAWLTAAPAFAAEYEVDYANSSITFSGEHAGKSFTGTFGAWKAMINFDQTHLAASSIEVIIDTASAKTGEKMYDGALPTSDWFDVKDYPRARFISDAIRKLPTGEFEASGTLSVRAAHVPVSFTFALLPDPAAEEVETSFALTLDRMALSLGLTSDPKAEFVSRNIGLQVKLKARRK